MLVVTTNELSGWEIQRVCGEVFGLAVRQRGAVSGDDARTEAKARMLEQVRAKGGNAVVGMRLDASSLGDGGSEVCMYGTAVVATPANDAAKQTAAALGYGQPAAAATSEQPAAQQPGAQQTFGQPGYQQTPYGQPGYQQTPYGQPGYPQQGPPQQPHPQGYPQQGPPQQS